MKNISFSTLLAILSLFIADGLYAQNIVIKAAVNEVGSWSEKDSLYIYSADSLTNNPYKSAIITLNDSVVKISLFNNDKTETVSEYRIYANYAHEHFLIFKNVVNNDILQFYWRKNLISLHHNFDLKTNRYNSYIDLTNLQIAKDYNLADITALFLAKNRVVSKDVGVRRFSNFDLAYTIDHTSNYEIYNTTNNAKVYVITNYRDSTIEVLTKTDSTHYTASLYYFLNVKNHAGTTTVIADNRDGLVMFNYSDNGLSFHHTPHHETLSFDKVIFYYNIKKEINPFAVQEENKRRIKKIKSQKLKITGYAYVNSSQKVFSEKEHKGVIGCYDKVNIKSKKNKLELTFNLRADNKKRTPNNTTETYNYTIIDFYKKEGNKKWFLKRTDGVVVRLSQSKGTQTYVLEIPTLKNDGSLYVYTFKQIKLNK